MVSFSSNLLWLRSLKAHMHLHFSKAFSSSLEHRGLCVSACRVWMWQRSTGIWELSLMRSGQQRGYFQHLLSVETPQCAQILTYSVSMPLKRTVVSGDVLLSHSVSLPTQIHPWNNILYAYDSKYVNHKLVQSRNFLPGICFYVFWWDLRQAQACITVVCLSSASDESPQPICSGANQVTLSIWTSSNFPGLLSLALWRFHSDSYIQSGCTRGKLE